MTKAKEEQKPEQASEVKKGSRVMDDEEEMPSSGTNALITANASNLPTHVVVHPLVLLSVVDHYNRVAKSSKRRVVGVLLGQNEKGSVNVANSFAVPFEDDEKDASTWFLDHNFLESMSDMMKKVNAREKIIGWYHTGPKLRSSDLAIHHLITKYTPNPVLVVVDVRPELVGLPTQAYAAVEEISEDGTCTTHTFNHVASEVQAEEAEEIGVEHLLRDIKDNAVGSLSTRITSNYTALVQLEEHLGVVIDYLDKVSAGRLPINHGISYLLQNVFNLIPQIQGDSLAIGSFRTKVNDETLVMYIASLVRATTALHDLVDNKLTNREEEQKQTAAALQSTKSAPTGPKEGSVEPAPEK